MTRSTRAQWFGMTVALATMGATPVWAQSQPAASPAPTNVGPGRIICHNASACELSIGAPATLKYKIDPSALPAADKDRLTKQCIAKGTPCVVTVTGSETKTGVKAASIKFYN
jgi:hypothetical protein